MKLLTVFEEAIKDISKNQDITKEEYPELISEILDDSIDEIIQKTKIPKPPSPIEIAIERLRLRNKRHSKHFRETHKQINYSLWYLLYQAKLELTESAKSSFFEPYQVDDSTRKQANPYTTGDSNISSYDVLLSNSSEVVPHSKDIAYFELSPEVEKSISEDIVTAKFISKIEQSCRTLTESLSTSPTFTIYKKTDVEIPSWNTLNLKITLPDETNDFILKFWKKLRNHIDSSIEEISFENENQKEKLLQLKKSFYIQVTK